MASKPSALKMTYFDGRGRGEILRLIMAKGGVKHDDVRLTFEQWPEFKGKTPFGSMPVLELNGKMYAQALALAIFLARENKLYGANNLENLMIDQILMCREDIVVPEAKIKFEQDQGKRAELTKDMIDTTYPKFFGFFDTIIKDNPTKSGWAVGKKISMADLVIFDVSEWIFGLKEEEMRSAYPNIAAVRAKVATTPGIKEYLANRKETPF